MKSSETKLIKPCKCGSVEFVTMPNQYDVYQIIDNKLEFVETQQVDDDEKLFCRECSEEVCIRDISEKPATKSSEGL